jgi:hypothetical protein
MEVFRVLGARCVWGAFYVSDFATGRVAGWLAMLGANFGWDTAHADFAGSWLCALRRRNHRAGLVRSFSGRGLG